MAKLPSWRRLIPGIATLVALVGIIVSVLVFARVGSLHGSTIRLYVSADNATGVIRGTQVWLLGESVGQVSSTMLRPISIDTSQRVLVAVDVLTSVALRIRRDTRVQIRPGGSMVGQPVVYFSGGTAAAPAVRDGDTIVARPQSALDETRDEFTAAAAQVPVLKAEVESLTTQLSSNAGTIGAVEADEPRLKALTVLLARRTRAGPSRRDTVTSAARTDLEDHVRHALAAADSLRRIVASPNSTVGRFERDTTLQRVVRDVRAEIDSTKRLLAEPTGTVGRWATDSAIHRQLRAADASMTAVERDLAAHADRYLPF